MTQSNPRKIVQNGSSLAVNIPPAILEDIGLEKGDRVVIESDGQQAVIEQVRINRAPTDE
jgi:antitoxin component of MazEF toxin-antitoxin module